MAQGLDQAQRQRELTKQALAADAERLQARLRTELDWRARLKRDGPRLAVLAGAGVVLIGALVVVRSRLRRDRQDEEGGPVTLEQLSAELKKIRDRLDKRGDASPFWQKALLRGLAAAGAAGGTYAARRLMAQQMGHRGEAEASGGR